MALLDTSFCEKENYEFIREGVGNATVYSERQLFI